MVLYAHNYVHVSWVSLVSLGPLCLVAPTHKQHWLCYHFTNLPQDKKTCTSTIILTLLH